MTPVLEPSRHLKIAGAYNIRDVGGYQTSDGRRIRWQTLLRAETLERLPPASQSALVDYGVRTVIDLRASRELEESPNIFANSPHVAYRNHNVIGDGQLSGPPFTEPVTPVQGTPRLVGMYTLILDRRRAEIQNTLATLAKPGTLPALIHCSAGKDRTGIISALALSVAGVARETIAEDYALSAQLFLDPDLRAQAPPELADGFDWEEYTRDYCPPEAMIETLQHLDGRYGSIEAYLLGGSLSSEHIDTLRDALVE